MKREFKALDVSFAFWLSPAQSEEAIKIHSPRNYHQHHENEILQPLQLSMPFFLSVIHPRLVKIRGSNRPRKEGICVLLKYESCPIPQSYICILRETFVLRFLSLCFQGPGCRWGAGKPVLSTQIRTTRLRDRWRHGGEPPAHLGSSTSLWALPWKSKLLFCCFFWIPLLQRLGLTLH